MEKKHRPYNKKGPTFGIEEQVFEDFLGFTLGGLFELLWQNDSFLGHGHQLLESKLRKLS